MLGRELAVTLGDIQRNRRRRVPVFRVASRATQSGRWLHDRPPVSRYRTRNRATLPSNPPIVPGADLNLNLDLDPDLNRNPDPDTT
jgi:hypothetical protein